MRPATKCCSLWRPLQATNRRKDYFWKSQNKLSTLTTAIADSAELKERIDRFQEAHRNTVREVRKVIVGQDEVVEQVLISLFVGGHCLITGLPGTAKTLLVRTLAPTLGLVFKSIQFTPDLMPSDITGTDIIYEDNTTR